MSLFVVLSVISIRYPVCCYYFYRKLLFNIHCYNLLYWVSSYKYSLFLEYFTFENGKLCLPRLKVLMSVITRF